MFVHILQAQRRLRMWILCFHHFAFVSRVRAAVWNEICSAREEVARKRLIRRSAVMIGNQFQNWFQSHLTRKNAKFKDRMSNFVWMFSMHIRIFRKKKACKILRNFLLQTKCRKEKVHIYF
jgi:hypothetical protein